MLHVCLECLEGKALRLNTKNLNINLKLHFNFFLKKFKMSELFSALEVLRVLVCHTMVMMDMSHTSDISVRAYRYSSMSDTTRGEKKFQYSSASTST